MTFTPYVEAPTIRLLPPASGGMDTTGFDQFRQGVEILNSRQRYLSIAKISAGPDDHQLVQTMFGQSRPFDVRDAYRDQDLYDPVEYVEAGGDVPQPVVVGVTDKTPEGFLDGIIEPLTIRDVVSFTSTEVPFFAHEIRGAFMRGNGDIEFGHGDIRQVYDLAEVSEGTSAFIDSDDALGTVQLGGLSSDIESEAAPFDDLRVRRLEPGVDSSFERSARAVGVYDEGDGFPVVYVPDTEIREIQLQAQLNVSSSSEQGLLSFAEISAGAGITYEGMKQKVVVEFDPDFLQSSEANLYRFLPPFDYGTDSIAFGGRLQ